MSLSLTMPQAEPSGLIPTLNKTGFMTSILDPYSEEFTEFSKDSKMPVLEIGSAYGISTITALSKGAQVIANDLEPKHLSILYERTPQELRKNLTLSPGRCPDDLNFSKNSIRAVLSCRVFHFFTGEKIMESLEKIFQWIIPGGKVFIVSETPYLNDYKDFIPIYEERKKRGDMWPGIIENTYQYNPKREQHIPSMFNLLDADVLKRSLKETGFKVEKVSYMSRQDYPPDLRFNGKESVGIIGVK